MTTETELIERIVHEVLRRLGTPAETLRSNGSESGLLEINDAVVTGDLLAERVNGTTALKLGSKTVLTPSARDFIRANQLDVHRGDSRPDSPPAKNSGRSASATSAAVRVLVVDNSAALDRALDDLALTAEKFDCPDAAAETAAEAIQRRDVHTVLLFASWNHRAAMLANRHDKVRAAAVNDAGRIAAAHKQMKPNVWCLDAGTGSYFELRNQIRSLTR